MIGDQQLDQAVVESMVRDMINKREATAMFKALQEAEYPPEPFDAGTLKEILARPPAPPARVMSLIPARSSTLVVAQRKVGKTTLLLNLARSLLTGDEFLGEFGVLPVTGRVGFLNFEVDGQQLGRWAEEVGVPLDGLYVVNLRGQPNPLRSGDARTRLAALLHEQGVEVLIVDPFARAFTGTSQNDAGEVGAFLTDLDIFARAEVGANELVLSTHAGWEGDRTRGSSALEDWPDSIITLSMRQNDRFLRAIGRDVEMEEDRLEYDERTRRLSLTNTGGRRKAAEADKIRDLLLPVIEAVGDRPGMNGTEIEQLLRQHSQHKFQKGIPKKAADLAVVRGLIGARSVAGRGGGTVYFPIEEQGS